MFNSRRPSRDLRGTASLTVMLAGVCLLAGSSSSELIKIAPYGKVRPSYRVHCLTAIPSNIPSDQLANMTVVWRDVEGHAIGESPVSVFAGDNYLSSEMSVQFAGASALFSCAFKKPGGSALSGLQFSEIFVVSQTGKCDPAALRCDPGQKNCNAPQCVCKRGEHLVEGLECVPGYKDPIPCPVVNEAEAAQCKGSLRVLVRRAPYVQCRQRRNRTLLDRVKQLVPHGGPRPADYSHCPCRNAMDSNIVEINGFEYCQDVRQVLCCVAVSYLADSHDFSLVWFTLISISIFIGLVLVAAFVLMVCKSRQQLQAQHRAQLRAIALQQQQHHHHHDEHFHAIYDPRVHRSLSVASDKPPAYHEVVRREASTPPPAYNLAVANLAGISPVVGGQDTVTPAGIATTVLNSPCTTAIEAQPSAVPEAIVVSRPSTPCPGVDQVRPATPIQRSSEGKSCQD